MDLAPEQYVAFAGSELIARGPLPEVVARAKARLYAGEDARIALYDDQTGHILDVDYSGSTEEVIARLPVPGGTSTARKGPGRPRLGVVSREISLLPRHWEWLAEQRGGASATLRRLVDAARKTESHTAVQRRAIDAAHRFLWDIAGNEPHFEEVTRALFAGDFARCKQLSSSWPKGIQEQLTRYLERVDPVED